MCAVLVLSSLSQVGSREVARKHNSITSILSIRMCRSAARCIPVPKVLYQRWGIGSCLPIREASEAEHDNEGNSDQLLIID